MANRAGRRNKVLKIGTVPTKPGRIISLGKKKPNYIHKQMNL